MIYKTGMKVKATSGGIQDLAETEDLNLAEVDIPAGTEGIVRNVAPGYESTGPLVYVDFPGANNVECLEPWIEPA